MGEALTMKRADGQGEPEIAFDRARCLAQCRINTPVVGAGVCGKCVVGLPCSYRD